MMAERLAVIDTGTNSTRMLIVDYSREGLKVLSREHEITRLGESVSASGSLDHAARKRVEDCVARFHSAIDVYQVARTLLFATSSVRDAMDGEEYIEALAESHGFDHVVLSGRQEAALAYSGAMSGLDSSGRNLLFDIGGGSTEIVSGEGPAVRTSTSLQLGCVRLRELFFESDPPSPGELEEARSFCREMVRPAMAAASAGGIDRSIAVAGTMTTLAALDLGLERYDRDAVHGHRISYDGVKGLFRWLAAMSTADRGRLAVIERGRADVIVAGCLIAVVIMAEGSIGQVTVSEQDILDGAASAYGRGQL